MGTIKRYAISSLAELRTLIGRNNIVGFIGALDATYTDADSQVYDITLYSGAIRGSNDSIPDIDFIGQYLRKAASNLITAISPITLESASGYIYIYTARQRRTRLITRTLLCKECA